MFIHKQPVYAEYSFSLIAAPLWVSISFMYPEKTIDDPVYEVVRDIGPPVFWQCVFLLGFFFSAFGMGLHKKLFRCLGATILAFCFLVMTCALGIRRPIPLSFALYSAGAFAEGIVVIWQVSRYVIELRSKHIFRRI